MQYPFYNLNPLYVDLGNGTSFPIPAYEENLFISYINYSENVDETKKYIHIYINDNYKEFPLHLQDAFIDNFIKMHPGNVVETPPEIPLYSINNEYTFSVSGDTEDVTITAGQEKELVDIINQEGKKCKDDVIRWFHKYYEDRGLSYLYPELESIGQSFIASKGIVCDNYHVESNVGKNVIGALYILLQVGIWGFGAYLVIYLLYCMIFK